VSYIRELFVHKEFLCIGEQELHGCLQEQGQDWESIASR